MAVLHFFQLNSSLYILFSMIEIDKLYTIFHVYHVESNYVDTLKILHQDPASCNNEVICVLLYFIIQVFHKNYYVL